MKNIYFRHLFHVTIIALSFMACSDNDSIPGNNDNNEICNILAPQPTTDEIKILFSGKTLFWDVEDTFTSYIAKRIQNQVSSIDDTDLQFILLSETSTEKILASPEYTTIAKTLWNKKKAFGFLNPGRNALSLLEKLRNNDESYTSQINDELIHDFSNIKIFITQAEGKTYIHDNIDNNTISTEKIIIEESKETNNIKGSKISETKLNDYHWGVVAESISQWLCDNILIDDETDPALVKNASTTEYTNTISTITWTKNLTVDYDEISEYNNPNFHDRTICVSTYVKISGGYYTEEDADIYDVEIINKFPISQIYFENVVLNTYGLVDYKDKYTGYCYVGPRYNLWLSNSKNEKLDRDDVAIFSASPSIENGEISTTHYPLTASFGSSITGGVSAEGPSLSAGFSSNFTLPYDAETRAYKEMKFNYSENDGSVLWDYYHDGYWIYDWYWGFNGSHTGAYAPAKSDVDFSFMLTYKVANSKSLGETDLYLNAKQGYRIYSEVCKPKHHFRHNEWNEDWSSNKLILPIVYRYFGKYTPSYYSSTIPATSEEWSNLKTLLEGNPNYLALSNDAISVGARVEKTLDGRDGVEVQAERIWEETINSIINQRNGHTTVEGEWVIGLYGNNEKWLKKGLHIKNNEWKIVDDITQYDNLRPE